MQASTQLTNGMVVRFWRDKSTDEVIIAVFETSEAKEALGTTREDTESFKRAVALATA